MGTRIVSTGSYLPDRILTNRDLESIVDTSDEWIVQRTGIRTRHLLAEDEHPSHMGAEAAARALAKHGTSPADVDMLLVATTFPDMICPGSAPFIAAELGLSDVPFFDLKAGCTGFVYGLTVADSLVRTGTYNSVLLIGTEALSRVADWSDRRTCVLFGDGAGAALLQAGDEGQGVLGTATFGDADKSMLLHSLGGGTRFPLTAESIERRDDKLKMEGSGVFRSAVAMMEKATHAALEQAGLSLSDIDWVIPHQANARIIDLLVRRLEVPEDRVIVNLDRVANTSAASIPIALDEAMTAERIRPGDLVVMTAFGAGVTYGAVVLRV